MARPLKYRAKDNKWRLWSTNSDQWLTEWLDEDGIKQAIAREHEIDYKQKIIELYMTFPAGYYNKDIVIKDGRPVSIWFRNDNGRKAFSDWQSQAFKGNYYEAVDKKFKELTKDAA